MNAARSIRWRMIVLFCVTAGVLLGMSYAGLYVAFQRVLRSQFDRRLTEIAGPIIADLSADPDEKDVDELNIPEEYFEVRDDSGIVLQHSKNLPGPLPLSSFEGFQTVRMPGLGEIRVGVIPFQAGVHQWLFITAASTREVAEGIGALRRFGFLLLPASLVLTAAVFGFYSNQLLARIDSVVRQLRQFVSDASHELRTPLAVLQGETELVLARRRSAEEYENAARVVESELKKLTRIVDGLFTLSMADAGQLQIRSEPLYLEEVLDESCALAMPLASQKQIRIERRLEHDVLFNGDAPFLRQLFLIFLDNAIKYSPSRSCVRVTLEKNREDIFLSFQDEGIGIRKEDVPHIFKRFFRAAPSTDTQSGGLGLAIAQAIVQAHDGTIDCKSEPGLGSIFTVRLPCREPKLIRESVS